MSGLQKLSAMPIPDQSETVDIVRIAPGGEGVAKCMNGQVCFVAGTAPGDRVEVGQFARSGGALRGRVLRLVTPSPLRREPPCPYAGQCGGCDFMHLEPEAQRQQKLQIIEDAMLRIAGDPPRPAHVGFVQSAFGHGYRSRLQLHVDQHGQLGLLSARTHRVVAINRCIVADEAINEGIDRLAGADAPTRRRLSFCEQIELRSAEVAPKLAVRLFARQGITLRCDVYASVFGRDTAVVIAGSTEDHEYTQSIPVTDDLALRVPFSAFTQVNRQVNRALVQHVISAALARGRRVFLDAYAGAGNFTLPLLKAGLTGEAIDSAPSGIVAARALARDLGLPFTGFNAGDARQMLLHLANAGRQFDFIVLDPPRQGSASVLDAVLRLHPRTIALVGCDPVALARDLGILTARGGRIESLTLFDMFPETHHVEALAIVEWAQ